MNGTKNNAKELDQRREIDRVLDPPSFRHGLAEQARCCDRTHA